MDLPSRMRADLTAALRERDRDTARVLRTALSAIANAEAQPAADGDEPLRLQGDGPIAGASDGLGSADVARRELTTDDVRAVVRSERDECLASAADLEARGATDAAAALRADAEVLERYVG
jgi:uncharacterized protein YqeY